MVYSSINNDNKKIRNSLVGILTRKKKITLHPQVVYVLGGDIPIVVVILI